MARTTPRTRSTGSATPAAPCSKKRPAPSLKDPWAARNDYIDLMLDRTAANDRRLLPTATPAEPSRPMNDVQALKLLEMQRHAMLMYTSCGWFFDELSGIETVQILMYAGRVIQLAQEDRRHRPRTRLPRRSRQGPQQPPRASHQLARDVYEKYVRPARLGWENVAAHFAVASLFESFEETSHISCYNVTQQDRQLPGSRQDSSWSPATPASPPKSPSKPGTSLTPPSISATTTSTPASRLSRDEATPPSRRPDSPKPSPASTPPRSSASWTATSARPATRSPPCSATSNARSSRSCSASDLTEITDTYQTSFRIKPPHSCGSSSISRRPIPMPLHATAEVLFNSDLRWAFKDDDPDFEQIRSLVHEAQTWNLPPRQQSARLPVHQNARPRRLALGHPTRPARTPEHSSPRASTSPANCPSSRTSGPPRTSISTSGRLNLRPHDRRRRRRSRGRRLGRRVSQPRRQARHRRRRTKKKTPANDAPDPTLATLVDS